MTERRLVRLLLFSVPFLCAFQWLVIQRRGEPYPALVFPGFGGFSNDDFSVRSHELRIVTKDGTTETHSVYRLLPELPLSIKSQLVADDLTPGTKLPADVADWLWQRVLAIEPDATSASIAWTRTYPRDPESAEWLGELVIR